MKNDTLPVLAATDLESVTGGFDIAGIASQIGGLVDSFTGGQGKGAQMGGQIGGLIQQFMGGQQQQPAQDPQVTASVTTGSAFAG